MGCGCTKQVSVAESKDIKRSTKLASSHQYNVIIWAASTVQLNKYKLEPTRIITYKKTNILYTFITDTSSETSSMVADSLVCIISDLDNEADEIKKISTSYQSVWNKKLLSEEITDRTIYYADSLKLQVFSDENALLESIYEDDLNLCSLLKEVFSKIDTDNSGKIDVNEIKEAAEYMGKDVAEDEIHKIMEGIDENKDGKISFHEFMHWWKHGKHASKSFEKLVKKWAFNLSALIPGSANVLRAQFRKFMNLKTYNKRIEIIHKNVHNPQVIAKLKLGKSIKREKYIDPANLALDFYSQTTWVALKLKPKAGTNVYKSLKYLDFLVKAQLNYGASMIVDGGKFVGHVEYTLKSHNSMVYLGFNLNAMALGFNNFVSKIDHLFVTPTDDCFECNLQLQDSFNSILQRLDMTLGECLSNGFKFNAELIHWVNFVYIIGNLLGLPVNSYALSFFQPFNGKIKVDVNKLLAIPALSVLAPLVNALQGLKSKVPLLYKFVTRCAQEYEDQLTVYFRCLNAGGYVKFKGIYPLILHFLND